MYRAGNARSVATWQRVRRLVTGHAPTPARGMKPMKATQPADVAPCGRAATSVVAVMHAHAGEGFT